MKRLLLIASILLSTIFTASAKPPGEDESVPELVDQYIWLSCEAMEYSYDYMYNDLKVLTTAYKRCVGLQGSGADADMYIDLQCVFLQQHWDFRYSHIKSLEKAYDLMCYESERKNPSYEIDF